MNFIDYLVDTLRILGGLRTGLCSVNGTTTSLTDTVRRTEITDYWNDGTIWILSAGGAAPENEFAKVTDFGSGTFTHVALTAATDSADRYAASPGHYPYDVLIDCVNLAMKQYRYPKIDITSLDVVAGQTEYTLPSAIQIGRLREVYVQTQDDANDNRWQKVGEWWTTDDGTDEILILPEDLLDDYAGNDLRLDYEEIHTDLTAGDDTVHDWLEPKYVIFRAAEFMLLQQMYDGDEWPYIEERMNYFISKADEYEKEFNNRIWRHRREK